MVWISYSMGLLSIALLTLAMITIFIKQSKTNSLAVYLFILVILGVLGWIIGNMITVYLSQRELYTLALTFSRFNTFSSIIAMIATVFFANTLMSRHTYNHIFISIIFFLAGGVATLTLSPVYDVVLLPVYKAGYLFYIAKTHILWIIFNASLDLLAGTIFLIYLFRQKNFVDKENKQVLNIMISGVFISYFGSALIFFVRKIILEITGDMVILHMEWIAVAIGSLLISIAIYYGSIEEFYYSSEIYAIYIMDKYGTVVYSASSKRRWRLQGQILLGITSAFSELATDLIGKKAYPKEIDFGIYSLLIEREKDHFCLVSCKYPTSFLKQGVKNLLSNFSPTLSLKETSSLVAKYLAFKPVTTK
ncbi:MAG: hypothetical protein ACTSP3_09805 [Candidatus Heimdallarchaeaceae archaeon]